MPWINPILTRLQASDERSACTCPRGNGHAHDATYRLTGTHSDMAGKKTGKDTVFLCTQAAASASHIVGIKHNCFNPTGAIG